MFKLEIRTGNAAFECGEIEIARMLREVATKLEGGEKGGNIKESNGNTVGYFELSE